MEFSRYKVIKELPPMGGGAVSRYEALQTGLDRQVELRILANSVAKDSDASRRFQQELTVLAQLEHPSIIPILDYGWCTDRLFYTIPERRSQTLYSLLEESSTPLSHRGLIDFTLEMCDALAYLHEKGVIHRGLSLEAIRKDLDKESYFIAEFDVIRPTGLPSLSSMGVGRRQMAIQPPETLRGAKADFRADQYLLGCVLLCLTLGQDLEEKRPKALVDQALRKSLLDQASERGLPRSFARLLQRLMQEAPAERFKDFGEVREELERIRSRVLVLEATKQTLTSSREIEAARLMKSLETGEAAPADGASGPLEDKASNGAGESLPFSVRLRTAAPFLLVALALLCARGVVFLLQLDMGGGATEPTLERGQGMEAVVRVVSRAKGSLTVFVKRGKARYACTFPESLASRDLTTGELILIRGRLTGGRLDGAQVVACRDLERLKH